MRIKNAQDVGHTRRPWRLVVEWKMGVPAGSANFVSFGHCIRAFRTAGAAWGPNFPRCKKVLSSGVAKKLLGAIQPMFRIAILAKWNLP